MKVYSVVVFLCVASLARAMTLRLELETTALDDLVKPFLGLNGDWTCSSGTCKKCETVQGRTACVVATSPVANTIHIQVVASGMVLFNADIKEKNPGQICKDTYGYKVCLQATKVDLQTGSACLEFSVTAQGQIHKMPYGCFTLKQKPASSELAFQVKNFAENMLGLNGDWTCSSGTCKKCETQQGQTACVVATSPVANTIHIQVETSGMVLFNADIKEKNPGQICEDMYGYKVCLQATKVDLQTGSACLEFSVTAQGQIHKMPYGCFTLKQKPASSELAFQVKNFAENMLGLNGDWTCSSGTCKKCETQQGQTACVVATSPVANTIHIQVETSGMVLFNADIKEKNPGQICEDMYGYKVCLQATKVDLQTGSACLEFSVTAQGQIHKMPYGCFTLKQKPASSELAFQVKNFAENMLGLNGDWTCSSGTCKKCETQQGQTACVVATSPVANTIHIQVETSGMVLFNADIKEKNPGQICEDMYGYKVCLQATKVDLQTGSACLEFSVTAQGQIHKMPYGCFTLKQKPVSSELVFQVENNAENMLDTEEEEVEEDFDIPVEDVLGLFSEFVCKRGSCTICKPVAGRKGCITATSAPNSINVKIAVSGYTLLTGEITGTSSGPFCRAKIPSVHGVTDLCLSARNVNIKDHSACLDLSVKVHGRKKNMSAGCFKIPTTNDAEKSKLGPLLMTFLESLGRGQM
ncbi:uncharacterized protein LOC128231376 [Mya arenaria]|uniref:uncharacterized protein LOC128231376 n=1 Tax=Mya arenaria TaxID=6604 RepID=UPI0022E4DC70|nr:uncharacterized protein LOC128231376 [Mya arenaria]